MKRCTKFIATLIFCCAATHVFAATDERVIAVLPGGAVQLEHTGKASFANLRFPDNKLAEAWLAAHALQQSISFEPKDTDRYGRTMIASDSEEKMLQDGAAMIYASDGDVPARWTAAEESARRRKIGIWSNADLVLTPFNAAQHENEFHVVEGTVTRIYANKNATYLNFGVDWHSDFSITIPAKLRRSMGDRLDAIKEGSHVRVRGRLYEENGPMITLNHADNLERY